MKVIIPTAAVVGKDLQSIGKLPPVIYPINQEMVFDILYRQYQEDCDEFRLVCCEESERVHKVLDGYDGKRVRIIDLPKLEDLGHTIWHGLKGCEGSVIVNFGDTIVTDGFEGLSEDAFFYSEDYLSNQWTFFEQNGGEVAEVYDKVLAMGGQREIGRLFVGVFRFSDAAMLRQCLEEAFAGGEEGMGSFYQAVRLYSGRIPLEARRAEDWLDIGHADRYHGARLAVGARQFNHIAVDRNRGMLRKTSDDREKLIGEIRWYLKLPTDVEYVRPRIFDYSMDYEEPYVVMEYYAYHTLHELFLYGDLGRSQWREIFERVRFILSDFGRYTVRDSAIRPSLEEVYWGKTAQRMARLRENASFSRFFERDVTVNGTAYRSLGGVMDALESAIPDMLYDVGEFPIIHGDLCFSNMMVDDSFSFVKLIDPRGRFGSYDIYGDRRYEMAKLLHSVDGRYDFIIKDLFSVEYDLGSASIRYKIRERGTEREVGRVFMDVFGGEMGGDWEKVELIEGLLFLSMIPLHGESLAHQMAMLGTALEILGRVADVRAGD